MLKLENTEVLANIYKSRKNHKLDEWAEHGYEFSDAMVGDAMYQLSQALAAGRVGLQS